MAVDRDTFRAALGQWPSGVTVVTTVADGVRHGMTASSFSSVSLEPPLVSVCVAHHVTSHDLIARAGSFAVSILAKDQVADGMRFAGMLPADDRFEGVEVHTAVTGAPVLSGALAWLDCTVWATHPAGDHTIFVGEVVAAGTRDGLAPLLYHDRAWGQFADVLPEAIDLDAVHDPAGATVLDAVFGNDEPLAPEQVAAAVRDAMSRGAELLVLDDAPGVATPMQVRATLQSIQTLVGRVPVCLRLGDGPFASANLLTALKSGVTRLQAGDGWIDRQLVVDLVASLDIQLQLETAEPS